MATKHTHRIVFGRREAGCPRCAELNAGAAPIRWRAQIRADQERAFARDCTAHFAPDGPHARGVCGPVCTFGDC